MADPAAAGPGGADSAAPVEGTEPRVHADRPVDPKTAEIRAEKNPLRRLAKILGPGLITGA